MPLPTDALLARRPANVVHGLPRESRLVALGPRDLYRALEGTGAVVPSLSVPSRAALRGLVEAVRSVRAAVSFRFDHGAGRQAAPWAAQAMLGAVAAALDDAEADVPFFLHAELLPCRQRGADDDRDTAHAAVDAGFASASFDPGNVSAEAAAAQVMLVTEPFVERELGVEVALPPGATPEVAADWVDALEAAGLDDVGLLVRDAAAAGAIAQQVFPRPVAVLAADTLDAAARQQLGSTGLRRAGLGEALTQAVIRALPPELRLQVRRRGAELGLDAARALAPFLKQVDELAPAWQERIEAQAFHEAVELVRELGATGSGPTALRALVADAP